MFWFHYTPDALVVPEQSPIKTFADFVKAAKADPGQAEPRRLGPQLGQPRRARAPELGLRREDDLHSVQGHGRHDDGGDRQPDRRRDVVHGVRHQQQGQGAGARRRDGQAPSAAARRADVQANWASTGWTAPTAASACPRARRPRRASACRTCGRALNTDPEMKALADKSGFELVNVGTEQMDAFMKDKIRIYTEGAQSAGPGQEVGPARIASRLRADRGPLPGSVCTPGATSTCAG